MKLCIAYRLWLQEYHQSGFKERSNAIRELMLQQKSLCKSEGPSCWICLEAGPDFSGQPLRRDCACCGESAGFAHLSCVVQYAEHKQSEQGSSMLNDSWTQCPNCWQHYENALALDLLAESVTFVKKKYPNQDILLQALNARMAALADEGNQEAEEVANEIFSIIERLRSSDTSLSELVSAIEAMTYDNLGRIVLQKGTKDSAKAALAYFEISRELINSVGDDGDVLNASYAMLIEDDIAEAKSKCGGKSTSNIDKELKRQREWHEYCVKKYGEEDVSTIISGLDLSRTLYNTNHGIEAERLVEKLAITSDRVLGPEHKHTQTSRYGLGLVKRRDVSIRLGDEWRTSYQALQYKDDGDKCIVQGPISDPRNVKEEERLTVPSEDVYPTPGTPVSCHGLDSSPHLNGKIGDLIAWNKATDCYIVRFDDKDLKPSVIKRGNLQILFQLPDE